MCLVEEEAMVSIEQARFCSAFLHLNKTQRRGKCGGRRRLYAIITNELQLRGIAMAPAFGKENRTHRLQMQVCLENRNWLGLY